jgi:hypothetical protein
VCPACDVGVGPEDFRGSDEESHYVAPALWRDMRKHRLADDVVFGIPDNPSYGKRSLCGDDSNEVRHDDLDPEDASPRGLSSPTEHREHDLKTWPLYFQALIDGTKTFEIRRNDREYAVGDILVLREWDPSTAIYTGRSTRMIITYMTEALDVGGLSPGCVCMSVRPMEAR